MIMIMIIIIIIIIFIITTTTTTTIIIKSFVQKSLSKFFYSDPINISIYCADSRELFSFYL